MSMNGNRVVAVLAVIVACFAVLVVPSSRADDAIDKLYASKCAACHGADGKGQTALGKSNKLNDFASAAVQKQSDEELINTITNGKGKMPAYGKTLKPDQIKGLVAYIRGLANKG
jgi:cytochrome c6